MTLEQLVAITGSPVLRCQRFMPALVFGMGRYEITKTREREACFLATIAHESGGLQYTTEIWAPTAAQLRYEGRKDLGNTEKGDGSRFRGRGLIQITGRDNYAAAARALNHDYVNNPELLAEPEHAALSACWWWQAHGCNELADERGMEAVTRRVNGGLNGYEGRLRYYRRALEVLPTFANVQSGSATTAPSN